MIVFNNIKKISGERVDFCIQSNEEKIIAADDLLLMPAVIDPHVHFRIPGLAYKEDWQHAAKAALHGGCTLVFDMPNTLPPTITNELLQEKKSLIDAQLQEIDLPLRYELFFGADKNHLTEIPRVNKKVIGIKVFMGCSTGNLVIDDDESLHAVFALAAKENMIVAVHAEDEYLMRAKKKKYDAHEHAPINNNYAIHSQLRDEEVAVRAVEKAIALSAHYHTRLYILHVSTADEVALIREAKKNNLSVFAETTPHHLFFDLSAYPHLQGRAVVNPPLRDAHHKEALFDAIRDGTIDTIGSDHAPHTITEKNKPYGECPSGMPGIEFMLPLLLNAYHEQQLTLTDIVSLTSERAKKIFALTDFQDWVIVDINKIKTITNTFSKCNFTPYQGMRLRGWPRYVIMREKIYEL